MISWNEHEIILVTLSSVKCMYTYMYHFDYVHEEALPEMVT